MSAANALATLAARIEAASTSFFTLNNPLYQNWGAYIDNRNPDVSLLAPGLSPWALRGLQRREPDGLSLTVAGPLQTHRVM
jgi:hypothetical protein